jgi:RHS repeat-associated protein
MAHGHRPSSARTSSPLRRWLRLAWIERLPRLTAWLAERLLKPRTADHRKEPKKSYRPEVSYLETRFVPNDILGLLAGAPVFAGSMALTGGFTTPALVLMRGWGANRPPEPELPAVVATTASSSTAAKDAIFSGKGVASWQPAQAPNGRSELVRPVPTTSNTSSPATTQPTGDGLQNPLGNDWLSAVDSFFGSTAQRPTDRALGQGTHAEGSGGSSGAVVPELGFAGTSAPGTGNAPSAPIPPDPTTSAAFGATSASHRLSLSIPPAPISTPPSPGISALPGFQAADVGVGVQTTVPQANAAFGRVPLVFEPNVGQVGNGSSVQFLSHGPGFGLYLTGASAVFALPLTGQQAGTGIDALRLDFVGANASPTVIGQNQLTSTSNYFPGSDPSQWHTYVPNYATATIRNIYPGVDLSFYGTNSRTLEYTFTVHPGASPSAIKLNWEGVTGLSTDAQGNLDLQTANGTVVENAPVVYQAAGSGNALAPSLATGQTVGVSTVLNQDGTVGFSVGSYDTTKDLVIDPVLGFSSYLGGSGNDSANGVAVDPSTGNSVIIVGSTSSGNFPTTTGVIQTSAGGAFVTKVNPTGNALLYSTYLGNSDTVANAVALDAAGNIYVAGTANQSSTPQGFVDKLTPSGGQLAYQLAYSSTIAGADSTYSNAIAVDQYGEAFVTGYANWNDGTYDHNALIVDKLSATGSGLWEAHLASARANLPQHAAPVESGNAIAVDAVGDSYITGQVSGVLTTTSGVVQPSAPGASTAFAVELNSSGTTQWATYLGGNALTIGHGIALDTSGDVYVTGSTQATNYATTTGVVQTSLAGTQNAFVTELNPTATTYQYSTYLGGSGTDQANAIAVDNTGYAYVVGSTTSTNFPTNNALYSTNAGGTDAFVTRLNPGATTLSYSTYMGGLGTDSANAVALDAADNAFVAGGTTSTNFPIQGGFQGSNAGGTDAFISQVRLAPAVPVFSSFSPDTGATGYTTSQNLTFSGTANPSVTVAISRSDIGVIGTTTSDGSGNWSFNYSGTTLPEGTYAFTATASKSGFSSPPSQPYIVVVDKTPPTVSFTAPATTASKGPSIVVTASDLNGLPDGTTVTVDVDKNNDGNFTDPGETGYTSGTLTGGTAVIPLPALPGTGTYPVRVRLNDQAGNQGTSSIVNVVVNTPTSPWIVSSAQVMAADPMTGLAEQQLGDATISFPVDLDQSPGTTQAGNPGFVYNSDEVSSKPVVQFTFPTANSGSLPATISAVLTWNGAAGATLTYSTAGDNPGDVLTMGAQVPSAVTTTGRYNWSLLVLIPGQSNQTINGSAFVVAEDNSPFGAGWTYGPTSQLFDIPASGSYPAGKLRVYGTGGYRFYQGTSSFTSPAGDNGTLSVNGTGWQYQTPDGQTIQFNNNGMETSWTSADGHQSLNYSYTGTQLNTVTAIDNALSTFTYSGGLLQTIKTVNNRTTTFAYSGTNLASVTNPDSGVHTFAYDGTTHRLTSDTWANLQHQWAYQSNGMLGTYTLGNSTSPTTTAVSPVAAVGLSAAAAGTVLGSLTDALSDKTTWQLDSQGRPLVQTAADGGVTTNTYSNGYLTAQIDPLNRTTTYTRDGSGYITSQTNPDGSIVTYQYQSAFHALTTVTNERNYTTTFAYDGQGHQTSQTNALGQTTSYTYNTSGEQIAATDPLGHTTSYSYDGDRRLSSMTDALGNVTSYTYDANGNPQTTVDALSRTTTTVYDVMGRETGTINALGGRTTMTYLANGLQLSQTDQNSNLTTYAYDSYNRGLLALSVAGSGSTNAVSDTAYYYDNAGRQQIVKDPTGAATTTAYDRVGRVLSTMDAKGNTTQTEYDLAGQTIGTRNALGNWTDYGYNSRGWQTTVTDALGDVTTTAYDLSGNKTAVTDPLNHTTSYTYDALNRQTVVTDALGYAATTAYDAAGRTLSVTDQNSHVVSYGYDADNRKTTQTDAYGTSLARTTTTTYDQVGNELTSVNALNQTASYTYDSLNRQITATDPLGHVTSTTYDAASNVQTVKSPLNLTTSYVYDAQNRPIAVTDPLAHTTTTLYDGLGNVAQTSDALGHATAKRYDQLGQDAGSTNALSAVTQQNYDAAGNLLSVTDPVGNVTSYVYDTLNRQIRATDPTGAVTTTSYDAAGRMTQVVDRDGRTVSYAYDADNREIGETWKSSTGSVTNLLTFTYDHKGNRLTASNNAGTVSYSYDALDRLATQTDVFVLTTTYAYDALNRQTSMQDSLGGVLTTVYDNAGRQTSLQFGGTGQTPARFDFAYDNQDRLSTLTRYTDLAGTQLVGTTAYAYDNSSNLQSITNKSGTAVTLSYYNYTYNSDNLVATESHSSTVGTIVYSGTNTYTYDSTNQLLTTGSETLTYDGNGNRSMSGYATGTANRTTNDGVYTYTYDSAGNLTQKSKGTGLETWYYGYDNKNMLTSVRETSDGSTNELTTTYTYDALGNQVQQDEWKTGGSTVTTRHGYDDQGNAWADVTSGNAIVMRYLRGGSANQMLAQIDSSGNLSWYLTDHLGSARDILNAAGTTVTDHIDYSAFGKIATETNSAATGRAYLYTGLAEDRETGIVQAQRRDLLTATGQWMQEDPIAFQGGDANLRRYVSNNPPSLIDPTGLYYTDVTPFQLGAGPACQTVSVSPEQVKYEVADCGDSRNGAPWTCATVTSGPWGTGYQSQVVIAARSTNNNCNTLTDLFHSFPWTIDSASIRASVNLPVSGTYTFKVLVSGYIAVSPDLLTIPGNYSPKIHVTPVGGTYFEYTKPAGVTEGSFTQIFTAHVASPGAPWYAFSNYVPVIIADPEISYGGKVNVSYVTIKLRMMVLTKITGCLAAGTPLLIPGGSRPIEQFAEGDEILCKPESHPERAAEIGKVEQVFVREGRVLQVYLGEKVINTTAEHPFYVPEKGWTAGGKLHIGDRLVGHNGQCTTIDNIVDTGQVTIVYNLRIAPHHTYFVGSDDWGFTVWMHNTCLAASDAGNGQ